jgi:MFS family permease
MWQKKSFRHMSLGAATQAFVGYGAIAWMPMFLVRSHDMSSGEVGTALGLIIGICGGVGTFLGGYMADRLGTRNVKWYMLIPALGFLISVPFGFVVFYTHNLVIALACYCLPAFLVNLYTGPTFGMTQGLAPLAMRAAAAALLLFIINIIGLVFGPTTVGLLSDWFQSAWQLNNTESLRFALMACNMIYIISFINYYFASRHLENDLANSH